MHIVQKSHRYYLMIHRVPHTKIPGFYKQIPLHKQYH